MGGTFLFFGSILLLDILARANTGHALEGAGKVRGAGIIRQVGDVGVNRCLVSQINRLAPYLDNDRRGQ